MVSIKRAKEIMADNNFLGPREVAKYFVPWFKKPIFWLTKGLTLRWVREIIRFIFGINPWWIGEVPFSEATLEKYKDTHVLVAGYPLSILDIRRIFRVRIAILLYYAYDGRRPIYENEAFANTEVDFGWYLIRKDVVPNSLGKDYGDRDELLEENEEVARACEVVYVTILYYWATGTRTRLFSGNRVWCSDLNSDGERVSVGHFDYNTFRFSGCIFASTFWSKPNSITGISSLRKK